MGVDRLFSVIEDIEEIRYGGLGYWWLFIYLLILLLY